MRKDINKKIEEMEKVLRELRERMRDDEKEADEDSYDDDYERDMSIFSRNRIGRKYTMQICLTAEEKEEFDKAFEEFIGDADYPILSRSALLRYLLRYFLKNRSKIDLSKYQD